MRAWSREPVGRMRIMYVSNSPIPSRAANSIHVMNICHAIAKDGHRVSLMARMGDEPRVDTISEICAFYGVEEDFRIRRHWWPRIKGQRLGYLLSLVMTCLREQPDLVIGRHVMAIAVCALIGRPAILDMHGPFVPSDRIERWLYSKLTRSPYLLWVTTNSHALAGRVSQEFQGKEIRPLHNGANPIASDLQHHGALSGCPSTNLMEQHCAGYLGNLYPGRGIELILELAKRLHHWRFVLAGGSEEDIETWRRSPLPPNVEFRGFVRPADVGSLCLNMDVLLMPYQSRVAVHGGRGNSAEWMCPLKMFQYMASGKPIVASNLPVLREILSDGVNALLVPPTDLDAWARALERLEVDAELRETLGSTARHQLEEKYTWANRAAGMLTGFGSTPHEPSD